MYLLDFSVHEGTITDTPLECLMYLLDSNIFIEAKNRHYGFDFCPAFWDFLIREHKNGKIYSIDKVKDEIAEGDDALVDWTHDSELNNFFLSADEQTTLQFRIISEWVHQKKYRPSAINEFMGTADYYLIAQGKQRNAIIVTHETLRNSLKKIRIPDVCEGLDIQWMTPFVMLRTLQAKFVLQ